MKCIGFSKLKSEIIDEIFFDISKHTILIFIVILFLYPFANKLLIIKAIYNVIVYLY